MGTGHEYYDAIVEGLRVCGVYICVLGIWCAGFVGGFECDGKLIIPMSLILRRIVELYIRDSSVPSAGIIIAVDSETKDFELSIVEFCTFLRP